MGNVTEEGKDCFNIPQELDANRFIGENLVEINCSGCHQQTKVGRKFSCVRTETAKDPMFFTPEDFSDQDIAHITAYFMRFSTISCPEDACVPR
jgi:hypothetical protein